MRGPVPGRLRWAELAVTAGLLLGASVAAAAPDASMAPTPSTAPEVLLALGSTLGVTGAPGSGGASATFGLLFPIESRLAFGGSLFVDDLGTGLGVLHDPNTGLELGTVATTHRWSYGGEWRAELRVHESRRVRLMWGAGFGYGRQERDQRGTLRDAASGVLASTGATFLLKSAHGHSLGTTLAIKRAFVKHEADPDRSTSWATAALEWRWQGTPRE